MLMCKSKIDDFSNILNNSELSLGPVIVEYIKTVSQGPHKESQLISVLHKVQQKYGYLSKENIDAVAQLLRIPTAKVSGVATFYNFFRLQRPGKYKINVCLGTACYVKGANLIADRFKQELGIDFSETSKDGMFTLEIARCLGTCGLAPVVTIGAEVYSQVTPDQVPMLLDKYRRL
jgi:NADH:ubiquinone oxidoreductase subunit E